MKKATQLKAGDEVFVSYSGTFSCDYVSEKVEIAEFLSNGDFFIKLSKLEITIGKEEFSYRDTENFTYSSWNVLFSKEALQKEYERALRAVEKNQNDANHMKTLLDS